MSGFETVFGFLFSFLILFGVFIGIFAIYQDQIVQQQDLLEATENEAYISQLKGDFEISGVFYTSGRLSFVLNNTGSQKLFFTRGESVCFDVIDTSAFVSSGDVDIRPLGALDAEYRFIDLNEYGTLTYNSPSLNLSTNRSIKIVTCGGVEKDYIVETQEFDFWNTEWDDKSNVLFENNAQEPLTEYQAYVVLNSSTFSDLSSLEEGDIRFLLPLKEQLVLDLPLDNTNQDQDEFSRYGSQVVLGTSSGSESSDPVVDDGVLFGGLSFDGLDDTLSIDRVDSLNLSKGGTVAFWMKWNGQGDVLQTIMYDSNSSSALFVNSTSSLVTARLNISGTLQSFNSTQTIQSNDWVFVTVVYDQKVARFYLDGQLDSQAEYNTSLHFEMADTTIGSTAAASSYFNGSLDEMKVFDIALSSQEILDLYHNNLRFRQLDYYIGHFESSQVKAFVQLPFVNREGNVSFQMYYDHSDSLTSTEDIVRTFNYTIPRLVGYPVSERIWNSQGIRLMSLVDNNTIIVGDDQFTLNDYGEDLITAGNVNSNDQVRIKDLAQVEGGGGGADVITPISWASTDFYFAAARNGNDHYCIFSPFGTANVDILVEGTPIVPTLTVDNTTAICQTNSTATADTIHIDSDIPVLFHYYGDTADDGVNVYPATTDDLYGVPSANLYVATGPNAISVTVNENGTESTTSQAAYSRISNGGNGNDGAGAAFRISANGLGIGAVQQGDSDGAETTTFAPEIEMSTVFGSRWNTENIPLAAPYNDANCSTYTSGGLVETIETGVGSNGIFIYAFNPGDATYIASAWQVHCDKPVWGYYERDSGTDETNMIGYPQMRQYIHPEPTITIS